MVSNSLKVLCFELSQDCGYLFPNRRKQTQFCADRSVFVRKMGGKRIWIAAKECRALFGNHTLHAIGVNRLEISQMTNNLPRRPLAGDWFGVKLFVVHALH